MGAHEGGEVVEGGDGFVGDRGETLEDVRCAGVGLEGDGDVVRGGPGG